MNEILKKNKAAFKACDPVAADQVFSAPYPEGAQVFPAKSGALTLTVNGISLHSRVNPWLEAEKFAESAKNSRQHEPFIVPGVFGLGLGYHVLTLAQNHPVVYVLEPDPGMVKLAMTHLDFSLVINRIRFEFSPERCRRWPLVLPLAHIASARRENDKFQHWRHILTLTRTDSLDRVIEEAAHIDGLDELVRSLPKEQTFNLAGLIDCIHQRNGPLSTAEIYTLLLAELTRATH